MPLYESLHESLRPWLQVPRATHVHTGPCLRPKFAWTLACKYAGSRGENFASRNFKSVQKCLSQFQVLAKMLLAGPPTENFDSRWFTRRGFFSIRVRAHTGAYTGAYTGPYTDFVMPPGRTMDLAPGIIEYNLYSFEYNYIHLSIKFMDLAMMVLADGVPWIML